MAKTIRLTKEVGILRRNGVIADLGAFRSILSIVRLETVIVFKITFAANLLLGRFRVVIAVELGLTRLELGVGFISTLIGKG